MLVCRAFNKKPAEVEPWLRAGQELVPGNPNSRKKGFALTNALWNEPEVLGLRNAQSEHERIQKELYDHFEEKIVSKRNPDFFKDDRDLADEVAERLCFEGEAGKYAITLTYREGGKLYLHKLALDEMNILQTIRKGTTDPKGEDAEEPPNGILEFGADDYESEDEVRGDEDQGDENEEGA
jgi:hypothetical protein